jgi:hypothetical protein
MDMMRTIQLMIRKEQIVSRKKYEPVVMQAKNWANRIVEYGEENPEQLLANPLNWRIHPKAQQVSLSGVLDDIGFIAPVIVNKTTGHMIDGHLRVSLALRNNVSSVPVVYVELSEQEEKEALVTYDPITNMAAADMRHLEELIGDMGQVNDAVRLLVGEIIHESNKKSVKQEDAGNFDEEEDGESPFADNPFGISAEAVAEAKDEEERQYPSFTSDNEWGIPLLDINMQCSKEHMLIERWGRIARHNTRMPGMWHFYTDDYKFTGVWKDPDVVPRTGCTAAIELNYTTSFSHPKAEVIYNIWRKRWLARYWQTKGIHTVVDMNVELPFWDLNFLGVPKGWSSYATRWYANFNDVEIQYKKAQEHAEKNDITFFVFATKTKDVEEVCKEKGWINVKMDMTTMGIK